MRDLNQLLAALDAEAPLAQRHLWLIGLLDWVRGPRGAGIEAAASRVQLFLDALEAQPELEQRFREWWRVLADTVDATALLADFGFAPRMEFLSEFNERLRLKLLPATPETTDSAELFTLAMTRCDDAARITALDADSLQRLGNLMSTASTVPGLTLWQHELLEAIKLLRQPDPLHRLRGGTEAAHERAGARDAALPRPAGRRREASAAAFAATPREPVEVEAAAARLRERLEACRHAATSVYPHLNEHGISVGLVFLLRQLRERVVAHPRADGLPDLAHARSQQRRPGVAAGGDGPRAAQPARPAGRELLPSRGQVTERSAETGEHYITRTSAEYRQMLARQPEAARRLRSPLS
jgi:site-specific recombinase